ncbi:DUF4175 domain-containing protein [Bizionia saleffrena]|uniref:DUF4175 domain-containing protein n=1 Tax=Bizionia saleffrena TaxID=291189 RepID=A0A8H2LKL2_9FLAO|nr:DUF4175 domain-containing protein [Bizionia saleffrena]TYB71859.1 DUF4175 domain-containing protein [Bizionia saleffrena]
MKTLLIILSAIGLLSFNSCKQKINPQSLMESPETRTEVFNTITQDDDYMNEFMENMQGNNQAMQMMQGNKGMMNMMMKGEGFNMMKDSTMTMNMIHSMMKDGKMMNHMMLIMQNEGMMSEACMQSSMKMMGDKGKNTGDMYN